MVTVKAVPSESFSIEGAGGHNVKTVQGWQALYDALETASSIARTLPSRVTQQFAKVTIHVPQTTEVERLPVQRVRLAAGDPVQRYV